MRADRKYRGRHGWRQRGELAVALAKLNLDAMTVADRESAQA